jgi:g-D-glutamyl-meso-diaminopimelate peptidase
MLIFFYIFKEFVHMFFADKPTQFMREKFYEIIKNKKNINHFVAGYSLCKRKIDAFQIGNSKKMVLLAGGFHGAEWLTVLVLMKFLYELADSYNRNFEFLNKNGVVIIPCVNPDGTEIAVCGEKSAGVFANLISNILKQPDSPHVDLYSVWKANARGVDINHNFDAGWEKLKKLEIESGITGPAKTRYGGEFPESEPETQTITAICRKNNFLHALAFHSQGEEIFWNYGNPIPNSRKMAEAFASISGYKLSEPEGLATGGGFKDWFISEMKLPAFTIEIGRGENPLPLSDFDNIYKKIHDMLLLSVNIYKLISN